MFIQNIQKYEAIQFKDSETGMTNFRDFFKKNQLDILRVDNHFDDDYTNGKEKVIMVYYINKDEIPDEIELRDNWYYWLDEFGVLNSCSEECFKEYYKIVEA